MDVSSKLTVYFEDPFWVAVYERTAGRKMTAARIVFGAEPKDSDVYTFLLKNWCGLRFSPPVAAGRAGREINPKRAQREAKRQVEARGAGTKAQQALKLLQEQNKTERKTKSRQQCEAEAQARYEFRQKKRKEKHRGH